MEVGVEVLKTKQVFLLFLLNGKPKRQQTKKQTQNSDIAFKQSSQYFPKMITEYQNSLITKNHD